MEKQYSTHYLPEKYKQHQFIDIYNFEITVLNTQSTAQQQKLQGNKDIQFFSTRAHGSGHRISLAKQPRPSLHGTIMEKPLLQVFCQLFASKTLSQTSQIVQIRTRYLANCLIKLCHYKGACILHLILVGNLSILILSVKNTGGGGFLLNGQNPLSVTKVICRQSLSSS